MAKLSAGVSHWTRMRGETVPSIATSAVAMELVSVRLVGATGALELDGAGLTSSGVFSSVTDQA